MQCRIFLLTLPLALTACGGSPQYVAPAPEGAVECAVSLALDMGYRRMEGDVQAGVVRVAQRVDLPPDLPAEAAPKPTTGERLRSAGTEPTMENQLIFGQEGGRLYIQIVSLANDQPVEVPMPAADAHARRILARCASP